MWWGSRTAGAQTYTGWVGWYYSQYYKVKMWWGSRKVGAQTSMMRWENLNFYHTHCKTKTTGCIENVWRMWRNKICCWFKVWSGCWSDMLCLKVLTCVIWLSPSICPGITDRADSSGAPAAGTWSCSVHIFLQEEVRTLIILLSLVLSGLPDVNHRYF